jgi:arylsulfatase A-like enzyme
VLRTLLTQPEVRANTVVVFTSDHGEYGGSHGLRGKGASAYEEAIRVPLSVRDFRPAASAVTAATGVPRTQLTSSVDVVGLLLTLGTGSNAWREEKRYEHLAGRHDLAAICRHPGAPGRSWILHATDEDVTEFATEPYASDAPRHVVAVRSKAGKLVVYSNWRAETTEQETAGQEYELYDYSEPGGRAETVNSAGAQTPLEEELWNVLERDAVPRELQEPLPSLLLEAQQSGMSDYANVEQRIDIELYVKHQEESPAAIEETQVG